ELIRHMVGREMSAFFHRDPVPPGREVLRLQGVTVKPRLIDISLTVRAGEIVGLGGLIGAGRTELCRALFGIDPIDSGTITIDGKPVHPRSPIEAVKSGIALIPEDRQRTGLAIALPVGHNLTAASLRSVSHFGFLDSAAERKVSTDFIGRLRIRCSTPRQLAG